MNKGVPSFTDETPSFLCLHLLYHKYITFFQPWHPQVSSAKAFFKNRIPSQINSVSHPGRITIATEIPRAVAIWYHTSNSPNTQKQIVAPNSNTPNSHPIPDITLPKNDRMNFYRRKKTLSPEFLFPENSVFVHSFYSVYSDLNTVFLC